MKKIKKYFKIVTIISLFLILVNNAWTKEAPNDSTKIPANNIVKIDSKKSSTDSIAQKKEPKNDTTKIVLQKTKALLKKETIPLKINLIKDGTGPKAQSGDFIYLYFTGRLNDSLKTIFNSVQSPSKPLAFQLGSGQVIKGWDKGIVGMQVGEKRKLIIQPEYGYGTKQVDKIPANSILEFDIELVKIESPANFNETKDLKWKELAPGVEFVDTKVGDGNTVNSGSKVEIHSTGWLTGGSLFIDTKTRGKALTFIVGTGKSIEGIEVGIKKMKEGGIRFLRIQPNMGYGSRTFARIPSGSILIFKIELNKTSVAEIADNIDIFPEMNQIIWQKGDEGLEYSIIKEGDTTATEAKMGNKVAVQYTGWLTSGKKFDSSRDRQQSFEFQLGAKRVIRGWEVGVAGMKPGEKRLLKIPPEIAYGSKGVSIIPPNATLVFAVELEEIK